jgi:fumarate reductase subunit C
LLFTNFIVVYKFHCCYIVVINSEALSVSLIGMNANLMCQYIEFVADRLLVIKNIVVTLLLLLHCCYISLLLHCCLQKKGFTWISKNI